MTRRALLRARTGPEVGMGHAMRTRAVAKEVLSLGGDPLLVVDDEETRDQLAGEGYEVVTAAAVPDWARIDATGAWLDGFTDWTEELLALREEGTFSLLVENRTGAREHCDRVIYPSLHYEPDDWDRRNRQRIFAGAEWIPLAREVAELRPAKSRDVDVLVTFGGSDPNRLTERTLAALDISSSRIVVSIGHHMKERSPGIEELVADAEDVRVLLPGTPLGRWMARSRMALTAVGTTLYELSFLGVPALVVANHATDREVLEHYLREGPHHPVGIAAELSEEGLRAALAAGRAELATRTVPTVPDLGTGASRLALLLIGRAQQASA